MTTRITTWVFKAAVRTALDPIDKRVTVVEGRHALMWAVAEQRSAEALHHTGQPVFDRLIEEFLRKSLNDQELTQFIERLRAVIADETMEKQTPHAELLLSGAMEELEVRRGMAMPLTDHAHQTVLEENVAAGKAMAEEAAPGEPKKEVLNVAVLNVDVLNVTPEPPEKKP